MSYIIKTLRHKAKKKYPCAACNYILSYYGIQGFTDCQLTYSEAKEIVLARQNDWCIIPGQIYIYQVSIYDGFQTTKSIPAIVNICIKYKLFEDY